VLEKCGFILYLIDFSLFFCYDIFVDMGVFDFKMQVKLLSETNERIYI